jgi:thiol-disulfide isomerase/thioredoxin
MWLEPEVKIHAPEIGRAWINSAPLSTRGLRGRVILVDFWDYTCVNCIRTLPYVREWHRRYHDQGLTVIGVHSPEFSFARTSELVEKAIREQGLEYPIVLDNEFQIWQSFANRVWPTKYLIDKDGYVRFYQLGEGSYGETEEAIQKLLREINPKLALPSIMKVVRETDRPGAHCCPVTPELYLGVGRGRLGNESGYGENEVKDYQSPKDHVPDLAYLDGPWFAAKEFVASCPLEERGSRIILRYSAAEVNLVMGAAEDSEAIVEVKLDGKLIGEEDAGEDVRREGHMAAAVVKGPRMYRLVKSSTVESRVLELSTSNRGLEVYAFTFVSCVEPQR